MARTFDTEIVRALTAPNTDEVFLVLIKVKHADFTNVKIVNNTENITSNGTTYQAFPFSIVLPADTEETQPQFRVTVTNADQILIDEIRGVAGTSDRVTCDIAVIAASDPDTLLVEWTDFELTDVQYDVNQLSFNLSINWFMTESFPAGSFTPGNFPGIF